MTSFFMSPLLDIDLLGLTCYGELTFILFAVQPSLRDINSLVLVVKRDPWSSVDWICITVARGRLAVCWLASAYNIWLWVVDDLVITTFKQFLWPSLLRLLSCRLYFLVTPCEPSLPTLLPRFWGPKAVNVFGNKQPLNFLFEFF